MSANTQFEQELDRLLELPPGEFTAARDEAAKRLRGDGQGELAAQVKQLRKPTLAVWVVNRLAHERPLDVQRLLKAGEALGKSQTEAAGGDAATRFGEARREEQHALERLAEAARELAAREGIGAPGVERAIRTLRAASLTEDGRELLKRGRLTEELEPLGFDALTAGALPKLGPKPSSKAAKPKDDRRERRQALKDARERVKELRAAERELAAAARIARREAEKAETQAATLRKGADEAEAKASAAADERTAAEADLKRLE